MTDSRFPAKPKKHRAFDSAREDAPVVHRQTYQHDCGAFHAMDYVSAMREVYDQLDT